MKYVLKTPSSKSQCSSRSFKVTDFGINGKPIYDLLSQIICQIFAVNRLVRLFNSFVCGESRDPNPNANTTLILLLTLTLTLTAPSRG